MKIIFAHGKEGSPNGSKATYLREKFGAITPDLYGKPLSEQVEIVKKLVKENPDCLLIGSSMGGAVASLVANQVRPKKLFLLAPALFYDECKDIYIPSNAVIIHGTNDDIVPCEVSKDASKNNGCKLILVNDCHRLLKSKNKIMNMVGKLVS